MKFRLILCAGLADEPLADLGGRTPLEAAKTPTLDRLAKHAEQGLVSFVPRGFQPEPDVACLSALGYDPAHHFTGRAPLDGLAYGLEGLTEHVVFRADLVTVLDEMLVDAGAGGIKNHEAGILLAALNEALGGEGRRFHAASGGKNLLVCAPGPSSSALEKLDCEPPLRVVGKKWRRHLPKGSEAEQAINWMDRASAVLENHEINRVRVDLGENPANRLWLWGQGRFPRLPSFYQLRGIEAAFYSPEPFARGIAKAAGLKRLDQIADGEQAGFLCVYYTGESERATSAPDLKSKIRHIEGFDAFLGNLVEREREFAQSRWCVTSDIPESLERRTRLHGRVPYLLFGSGARPSGEAVFNERTASQQNNTCAHGHRFIERLLSPGEG